MKLTIIRGLSAFAKLVSAIAALSSLTGALPEKYAVPALIALGIASTLKDSALIVCDWLDDGKRNGSYRFPILLMVTLLALIPCSLFTSCQNNTTTTTLPDGTVIVTTTKGVDGQAVAAGANAATVLVPLFVQPNTGK